MKNGTRVKTCFGEGTVVGKEHIFEWHRILVELDHGHTWSIKNSNAAFLEKDLVVVSESGMTGSETGLRTSL